MIAGLQRLAGASALDRSLLSLNIVLSSAIVWHVAVLAGGLLPGQPMCWRPRWRLRSGPISSSRSGASYLATPIVMLTLVHVMLYPLVRFTVPIEPLAIALASAVPAWLAYERKDCERGDSNPQSLSATGS